MSMRRVENSAEFFMHKKFALSSKSDFVGICLNVGHKTRVPVNFDIFYILSFSVSHKLTNLSVKIKLGNQ